MIPHDQQPKKQGKPNRARNFAILATAVLVASAMTQAFHAPGEPLATPRFMAMDSEGIDYYERVRHFPEQICTTDGNISPMSPQEIRQTLQKHVDQTNRNEGNFYLFLVPQLNKAQIWFDLTFTDREIPDPNRTVVQINTRGNGSAMASKVIHLKEMGADWGMDCHQSQGSSKNGNEKGVQGNPGP